MIVYQTPLTMFYTDSLIFNTSTGTYHVIIMVNQDLLTAAGEKTSLADMMHNYPNPFSHETTITMDIDRREPVVLEIFDIRGTKVRTLLSEMSDPGTKQVKWDGTNAVGFRLPEGVYLYRLTTGQHTLTKRMILKR